jgi:hypothetical protein
MPDIVWSKDYLLNLAVFYFSIGGVQYNPK